MANLPIASAAALTGAQTASGDLFPLLDVSAAAGSQGSKITRDELGDAMTRTAALIAALAAKLDKAGGTMTGALVLNPTSGAALTVRRNSKTVLEVTDAEKVNIGRYDGVYGSGSSNQIGWAGLYGATTWEQGGGGQWRCFAALGTGGGFFTIDNSGVQLVTLRSGGSDTLQLGTNHATTATHQTFKAHDVTTGVGADLILKGGTGSVADGYVKIGASTGGLAFFGAVGTPLISGNTSTNISSAGAGNPLLDDTQSDGGLAGGAYTFGGLVAALKGYGIIG